MELILLIIITTLLVVNIVIHLTKSNKGDSERLENIIRLEMKSNREEISSEIRNLRNELTQTLYNNQRANNDIQKEKFELMNRQQDALIKSTEKRLDEMRIMVEEKLQKTLNERIGQSFELVRNQLENVQKGLGEMKSLAQDVGGLKKVLTNVKERHGIC